MADHAGNMPSLLAVFPNWMAPVVRAAPGGQRELLMMQWGFLPPFIPGSKPRNPYPTNVRKTDCLVPLTSFSDPDKPRG